MTETETGDLRREQTSKSGRQRQGQTQRDRQRERVRERAKVYQTLRILI